MLHLSSVGEKTNVLLIPTAMCCSSWDFSSANHGFSPDYWGLRVSELSCQIWAGSSSRWQDGSLGLWHQVTK